MATVTRESIGHLHDKLVVQIETADYLPAYEKSLKSHSQKANIPGFRPGKVPAGLIKKMYGTSLFTDEVLKTIDKEVIDYLQNEKVEIFAQPLPMEADFSQVDYKNPTPYTFNFEIGLKPAISLPAIDALPIKAYNIDITEEMINEEVERLLNRYGNMKDKETVDSVEDIVNVNFEEIDAVGKEIEGGVIKDNSLLVKYFTQKVQNELMGKKADTSIDITIGEAFDEKELEFIAQDLGLDPKNEADKAKTFRVAITKVGILEKRALDEEFFKQLYGNDEVKTEVEFRDKVKQEIFNYWAAQSRNQIHDQLFHQLIDHTPIDFPQDFLKRWITTQNNQPQEGQPAKTAEQIEAEMPSFLNQLKWTLISDQIIKDNNIVVSPEDLKAFTKQQLIGYMGGQLGNIDDQPWIEDYINKMMKDRKYIDDAYTRIQSQKVFETAEQSVKGISTPISAEEFTKMVDAHQHEHHH